MRQGLFGRWLPITSLVAGTLAATWAGSAPAQSPRPSLPDQAPAAPAPGRGNFQSDLVTSYQAPVDDRLRALEEQNTQLLDRLRELSRRYEDLDRRLQPSGPMIRPGERALRPPSGEGARGEGQSIAGPGTGPTTSTGRAVREAPLSNVPEQLGRPIPPERDVIQGPGEEPLSRARVDLEQGVRFLSPDGNYRIEFHDLTQGDFRAFQATGLPSGDGSPLTDNFIIPRQRLYFTGQVDRYFDFYSVINRGYGSLDILDSFVNFKFDPAFNLRLGRTKTPYTIEYYKIAEGDLIAGERSVFVGNLAPNRQIGAMVFGQTMDRQLEYSVGVFNGPNRSFQDFNNFKNPFVYLSSKPFLNYGSDLFRHANFGLSGNYGRENDLLEPNAFRTANDETITAAVDNVSPTFLRFNSAAREVGDKAFWAADVKWFYRSFMALASYNQGFTTYTVPVNQLTAHQRVPYVGWSAAFTFFLTGEELTTRKEVVPLRDYRFRNPWENPGAVELFTRAAELHAGSRIFDNGLANAKLWANDAVVLDNGVNWYLNRYVKIVMEWQHSIFNKPVAVTATRFENSAEMFWLRWQLYY